MNLKTLIEKLASGKSGIKYHQLLLILSFVIGIISALAAFVLKNSVHFTHHLLTSHFSIEKGNYLFLAYPLVGIILTILFIKYFVKDDIGHGVSKILYAIAQKKGRIKPHNQWSSIIASTFTIGFGGSVGAEAPIVLTGAAIGSNVGRLFKLNHKALMLLIGCGSAAAIAGIFKAPIAGVVFTLEVLMLDLTMTSLIPLLIASVTGASVAYYLMGDEVLFSFQLTESFALENIPFIILLGGLCGFMSVYFTKGVIFIEGQMARVTNIYTKVLIGGVTLSLLIFLFPPLYGEGYTTISALLHDNATDILNNSLFYGVKDNLWLFLGFILLVVLFKVFATSVTNGSGGVGGIFAPTLFMGALTGYFLAHLLNAFGFNVPESHFALIGMAGMMAGVMHAPLTAIFLIAEITGGYGLFLPLMICAVIAFITIKRYENHSIYHRRLAMRGELLTHHKDKTVLTLMKMDSVLENEFLTVSPEMMLGDMVKVIAKSKRNIFPAINSAGGLEGVVLLDDIRNIMFNPDQYHKFTVSQLMTQPPARVDFNDPMEKVMQKFEKSGAWNLPVVKEGKYVGFVSKSKIFNTYRKVLVHFSDE